MAKRLKQRRTLEEVLQSLAEHMFPAELEPRKIELDSRASWGDTPLHATIHRDDNYGARLLIEAGADIDARGNGGFTPLHAAAFEGNAALALALLEAGADPALRCDAGDTAFDLAARHHEEVFRQMKGFGGSPRKN